MKAQPSSGRRPWRRFDKLRRRVETIAERGQRPLFWLLLLTVLIGGSALLIGIGDALIEWARDPRGEERRTIALPIAQGDERDKLPETVADVRQRTESGTSPKPAKAPEATWQEPAMVRRAAALLAQDGDLEAAVALLLASDHHRNDLQQVGAASYAAIDQQIRQQLPKELEKLRAYWQGLQPPTRASFYLEEKAKLVEDFSGDINSPVTPATWQRLTESAPPSLYYVLLHNLYVQTVAATQLPGSLVSMILATRFLPDELTLALLPPAEPAAPIAYEDHLRGYAQVLKQQVLAEDFATLFSQTKLVLLQADPGPLAWYKTAWGEPFCRLVTLLPGQDATLAQQDQAWQTLAASAKPMWARAIYLAFVKHFGELPDCVMLASDWLAPGLGALDKAAVLRIVRLHPTWRASLREMDYTAAKGAIPGIITQLHAEGYATTIKLALQDTLALEQKHVSHPQFPWPAIAGAAGIRQPVPAALADKAKVDWEDISLAQSRYLDWSKAPAEAVYHALQQLSRKGPKELRNFYAVTASLYALNRGLRTDEDEARRYPQLTPEPILQPIRP